MRLAKRLEKVNPSSTLAITAKAKKLKSEGRDIVNFAAGEPDFDTPDFVKDAAYSAIKDGFTKYTPTTGIPELKKAICDKFRKDNSLEYESTQIVVSNGAKHSIFNALFALINKTDEVLIPSPYWVSYPEMVHLCEGKPVFMETLPKNDFKIDPRDLEKRIGPRTKAFILNSPSNPTGSVYAEYELKQIAEICAHKKVFVISDEIYEKLIYDNVKHSSIASLSKDIYNLTITVNGLSKSHSMTGWRIGYLAAPEDLAEAISRVQDHSTSNPVSISQKAALAALNAPDEFSRLMNAEFQRRRDFALERLSKIKNIGFIKPGGAFYIFIDISKLKLDSLTVASRLLEEKFVSLIPGAAFGRDDYVRMSFATSMDQIQKGLDRIEEWMGKL
ncbi:MAG: pyridoxal phosphate-dependent aminotransferase [Candidatus Omnitrophica bacterium]|nr:pyridoxal phosphate-dependent aminotransferase [Candidatus Omnitrophota bacterium]MDD5553277.1 pyridoxal phosphate-dependent aminotransferase [Candidatus Omnitrophota bacterium]